VTEHEFEPVRGLPGELPKGETMLWQGAPDWWSLAQRAFHVRTVAVYFGLLMAWRGGSAAMGGADTVGALQAALGLAPVAVAALGLLAGLAWLTARTTVYTITTKRIVLRFGFALPKAINIPFTIIESATLKTNSDGSGDLGVTLTKPNKAAYLLIWPHARPWKVTRPQPSLRAIPNASAVAVQLMHALKAAHGDRGVVHAPIAPIQETAPQGALSPA
jgi:Bacterial PH domain